MSVFVSVLAGFAGGVFAVLVFAAAAVVVMRRKVAAFRPPAPRVKVPPNAPASAGLDAER